jgi:hypothetical protein
MFSFLASGIKKHYEIGETLGQYVIIIHHCCLIRPIHLVSLI